MEKIDTSLKKIRKTLLLEISSIEKRIGISPARRHHAINILIVLI